MKKILIQCQYPMFWDGRLFESDLSLLTTNNLLDQNVIFFRSLRDRLREKGYLLITADDHDLEDCEWVIFFEAFSIGPASYPKHWVWKNLKHRLARVVYPQFRRELYKECIAAGLRERVVLLIIEPPAVRSYNWDSSLHKLFPIVFTYDTTRIDEKKFYRWLNPRPKGFAHGPSAPFNKKKLLVCIQGNKHSNHPLELYSARRTTIRYFERNYPEQFDLYGVLWNRPMTLWQKVFPPSREFYPSYRGTIQDKGQIFPQYRFGLIYENSIFPGWISEKIFDCMEADCVPVYWGAPDITNFIPSNAFIDRRDFKSENELGYHLLSMTEAEYDNYRDAIRAYLASKQYQMFSVEACTDTFIGALGL